MPSPADAGHVSTVAVVGNVSRDVVDGGAPRPGGCPVFAAQTLRLLGRQGQILTRCADEDRGFFEAAVRAPDVNTAILSGRRTAAFDLVYDGGQRALTVTSIGDSWSADDARHLGEDADWVHVAPLARSDFGPQVLDALARGRRLSLDGQGLVREPTLGTLRQKGEFPPSLLEHVDVLKLAEEEADVVAGGAFGPEDAAKLGVAELLVTLGDRGVDVWIGTDVTRVPARAVAGVETTGAGDAFAVAYLVARNDGAPPLEAAHAAVDLVARLLEERRAER
jgi:sugar/nucleoside kinase (ribokinase family)